MAVIVGFRPGGLGGLWSLTAGRTGRSGDEVVLGRGLADDHDIAIGQRMDVPGRSFLVVGFSSVPVPRSAEGRGWCGLPF